MTAISNRILLARHCSLKLTCYAFIVENKKNEKWIKRLTIIFSLFLACIQFGSNGYDTNCVTCAKNLQYVYKFIYSACARNLFIEQVKMQNVRTGNYSYAHILTTETPNNKELDVANSYVCTYLFSKIQLPDADGARYKFNESHMHICSIYIC